MALKALSALLVACALQGSSPAFAAPAAAAAAAGGDAVPELHIPFRRVVLQNGLVVILHEDHSAPRVVIDLLWDVGSRHEVAGRTGFAHLFEHLMFTGTRRAPDNSFDVWLEQEGASNNASTSQDVTEYHAAGPSHVLPLLLWLEADRALDFGRSITQEKLDAQRDVVRNERRQTSENTPYGVVELRLPGLLYPPGHPYHHTIIGSHEDLKAASVADVKAFFAKHYDLSQASLVVAGDVEPEATLALVRRYFEGIPTARRPKEPLPPPLGPLTTVVRETVSDRVELPKTVMAWRTPPEGSPGDADLELLASVLGSGKASRLYKALVYDKKLAQSIDVGVQSGRLGSVFIVDAIARPGVSQDALEAAIDAELRRVRAAAVAPAELARARNGYLFAYTRGLQSLMGRARVLNHYEWLRGEPGALTARVAELREVTPESMKKAALAWLPESGRVVLRVVPTKGEPAGHERDDARTEGGK